MEVTVVIKRDEGNYYLPLTKVRYSDRKFYQLGKFTGVPIYIVYRDDGSTQLHPRPKGKTGFEVRPDALGDPYIREWLFID